MNKNPAVATQRGFFMSAALCGGLACCTPEFGFNQNKIVDFSAVEIADCNCKAGITTPR
jgi:hypothetical protein